MKEANEMAFMMTRADVGDYESWKPMFDQDQPRARDQATGWRMFRSVDNPSEVYIQVEFPSVDDAKTARDKLISSGVLDRFPDRHGPVIVEEAEAVAR
jgi:hypothetical protein